ncbi:uncharacterized protein LOC122063840, partial [Macadamia integrifolia]|uniref:uncharacterized protein LOC122063840 n=1 Tax=Macadamia integrifolia TaxID=60698 RepID=UPI001C4E9B89
MRALFWNIRGMKKAAGRATLSNILLDKHPDVVCLAEPMVEVSAFPSLFFNKLGYDACFIHNIRTDKNPNLWVIWKRSLTKPTIISMSDQFISLCINWRNNSIYITFVHASCFRASRRELWMALAATPIGSSPWLVTGDFNASLFSFEKKGPGAFNLGSASEFNAAVDACNLISVPSQGHKFTWTNNRKRGNVLAILDRSFCNEEWINHFHDCTQEVMQRFSSDHSPLCITSDSMMKPANCPCRIQRFWMDHDEFMDVVNKSWSEPVDGYPIFSLALKLKRLKPILRSWARSVFPNLDAELKAAKDDLQQIQSQIDSYGIDDHLFNLEADAKSRYLKALLVHEKLWAEKARNRWLSQGDRNSRFFHLSAKIRRVKNSIRSLKKTDGTITSSMDDLAIHVEEYYKAIYKASPTLDHGSLLDCIPHILDEIDVRGLEAIPNDQEIKNAIWDLDPDSSPGPDGYSGAFFRHCWELIGFDVCRAVKNFFSSGTLPKGINNSFLVLIPKMEGATSLDKFRPICMQNFFCKILSKVMATRLSSLLPKLISEEQGAFQKGKVIQTNISLASELANLMFEGTRGGGMGIKIDIQKAFDTISWSFLFKVLKKFGFPDTWIDWLHQILRTSRISVLLNGGPVGFFGVERGLRQGDPISPLLFILAEEVLCRGIRLMLQDKKLQAIKGPRGVQMPGFLLFADDIFFFLNGSIRYVRHFHDFLTKYQQFSGQQINLNKSKLFLGKMSLDRKQLISDTLGISICKFPTKYLGVEIFKGRVTREPLLPRWMRNFIWSGDPETAKGVTVSWDSICKPKQEGGLGIRRLRDVNKAFLCKQVWNIRHSTSALSSIINARFLKKNGELKKGYKSSTIWPGLRRMWSLVSSKERWVVGNGVSINCWKDRWVDSESFQQKAGLRDELFASSSMIVAAFIDNNEWNFPTVSSSLLQDFFLAASTINIPRGNIKDTCIWTLSTSGQFSTFSAWNDIRRRNPKVPWHELVWMKGLSPRQSIFGWRLCHQKLTTDDIIRKKGISLASKCIMCGLHAETLPHLFLNCSVSRVLWENFFSCFGFHWKDQSSIADLISWWKRKRRILSVKDPWAAGLIIVTDTIWQERNHRWHGGKSTDASLLFMKILRTLKESNLNLKGVIRTTADLLCCRKLGLHAVPGDPPSILEVIWCKPPLAWSKINIDGSSMGNPGRAGGGGVIRDSNGKVIFSFKHFFGISTNYYAEFMTFLHGIRHAMGQRITNLWIESDSVAVVTAVQSKSLP